MENTVTCLMCGHSAVTLARHLKAVHGITADVYRAQYPEARIRSEACEANRRAAITKAHSDSPVAGTTKIVICSCGKQHEVSRFDRKDAPCPECRLRIEASRWEGQTEGADYVSCVGCQHRAENLTSHVQNTHPEWVGCYPSQMVATNSAVRDKTLLKGKVLSDGTKAKMSASAGWNRGLTKETDERVAHAAEAMKGRTAWSKGLTKAEHASLQSTAEKLSAYRGSVRPWSNGLKADLAAVDFTPFLDETGAVDRKTMAEELGLFEPTVTSYMESAGLRLSTKYIDARAERQTIRLEKEELLRFTMGNGKVVVAQAMLGLGRDYKVIKRECARHGLETFNHLVRQTMCLDAISKALDGVAYEPEWSPRRFVNPP